MSFASQPLVLNVINPAATFTISPTSAAVGSSALTLTIYGSGFFADSVVQWNGIALTTKYGGTTSLTATIPAALLSSLGTAVIHVNTSENLGQATPTQNFSTYVGLQVNDIVWNATDGLIYATVPGVVGQGLGNSLVGIDPNTGAVRKTIFVGSEPNRLAISSDGTQAFVGLDGAAAFRQVNLTTGTAGVQVSLGGGSGIYNPPYTAISLAAVPGQPNSVALYASSNVVTIYDAGVARAKTGGTSSYFGSSSTGGLSFGAAASTLYLSNGALTSYTVDATGVTASKSLSSSNSATAVQYDNGRLYLNSGSIADSTSGTILGQFSVPSSYSTTPLAASGPVASDSSLNKAFVLLNSTSSTNGVYVFDETTFNLVGSIPFSYSSSCYSNSTGDLIRWGQNGLAYHLGTQLVILQSALVKDNSSNPVDLSLTAQAPATVTTGTSFATQFQVTNAGANTASGVTVNVAIPVSLVAGQIATSQGSCTGTGTIYCDLGTLASGSNATITVNGVPTTAGSLQVTAITNSQSFDSNTANNQATAITTVTGSAFNLAPVLTTLSPNLIASGSSTSTLTVTGSGFASGSIVNWSGSALPTTFVSSTSLTAQVDSSLVKTLGWASVTVTSAAPGGETSGTLTESIYSLIALPANAMVYDPFVRKLWTVLPSTSSSPAGNSLVPLDPATGTVGTAIQIGSEPNVLAETTSGNYLYIGLSGAKSLGPFNLTTQKLDANIPLTSTGYSAGPLAANAVATIPGVDTSIAVPNVGILDFTGTTATVRANSGLSYADAVFPDSGHAYTYDNQSTGAEFYRYTVDAAGVHLVDGTTLLGIGGFQGTIALDNGLVYGGAGGIVNPLTTPPSQVAEMPLGSGPYGTGLSGGGSVPYSAENKSFNIAYNDAGTWLVYLERFDTQHFQQEDQLLLPTNNAIVQTVSGTRWGQDGLAYLLTAGQGGSSPSQIMLLRGPFVLPAEAVANSAPTLTAVGQGSIAVGSANQRVTVNGNGFLAGASVIWNGVSHDTTFTDSHTLSVAVGASELNTAATVLVTCRNPGSTDSNAVSVTIR